MDRRTKYSQLMIKNALVELLEEKELDAITVTDICNRADVNRGTFYRYYRDVPDLFEYMEKDYLDQIKKLFDDDKTEDVFSTQLSKDALKKGLIMISENSELVWLSRKSGRVTNVIRQIIDYIRPYIMHMLESVCADKSEVEREYLFEYFFGGIVNMITKWVEDGMVISVDTMTDMVSKEMEKTIK